MIEVEAPDGAVVEFPDGTSHDIIKSAMQKKFGGPEPKAKDPVSEFKGPANIGDLITEGFTLGLSDDVAGLARAVARFTKGDTNFAENFKEGRDAERARLDEGVDRLGGVGTAAQIAGGLATGGPVVGGIAKTLAKQGLGQAALQGAKTGAPLGAVASVGMSNPESLEETAIDLGQGAVVGGVLGGGVAGAGNIIGKALSPAIDAVRNIRQPKQAADRIVGQALIDDGVTAQRLINRTKDGKLAVVDAAGDNIRREGRLVNTLGGKASERLSKFLHRRQFGQGDRVTKDIAQAIGSKEGFLTAKNDIIRVREKISAPLYEKARALVSQPNISRMQFEVRRVARRAKGKLRDKIMKYSKDVEGLRSVDDIDVFKKTVLDDAIGKAKRAGEGNKAGILTDLKKGLLKEADRLSPDYKKARSIWEGTAKADDALEAGRKFLRGDTDQTVRDIASMTSGEKEFFRLGVARELKKVIDRSTNRRNVSDIIFGNKEKRGMLRAAFPNKKSFDKFKAAMLKEARTSETKNFVTGGSPTAPRQSDERQALGVLGNLAQNRPGAALGESISMIMGVAGGRSSKVNNRIVDILTSSSPEMVRNVVNTINTLKRNGATNAQLHDSLRILVSGAAGKGAGALDITHSK